MSFLGAPSSERKPARLREEVVEGITGRLYLLDGALANVNGPANLKDYGINADEMFAPNAPIIQQHAADITSLAQYREQTIMAENADEQRDKIERLHRAA